MAEEKFRYVIVGAGLAGASACEGIREIDGKGSILLIGDESELPYHRPPLSKKLWSGQKKAEEIFVHDSGFYREKEILLKLSTKVTGLDARAKTVTTNEGARLGYEKLLLTTGGTPRQLALPGLEPADVPTFRKLDDYFTLKSLISKKTTIAIIGGGFIGLEMAAALVQNHVAVTLVFPEPYPLQRLFPPPLGKAILSLYRRKGVTVLAGDAPVSGEKKGGHLLLRTSQGSMIESDLALAGIGLVPETDLAHMAGLKIDNGIVVDQYLQTSDADIHAAGDNAHFPCRALGKSMRVEHWDNAMMQGKLAGRNMAGAGEPYDHLPYFFSDLFDFGFEAVGDIDASLAVYADWQKENETGIVYYLREDRVRGVLLCNVWDRAEAARQLIGKNEKIVPEKLKGAII